MTGSTSPRLDFAPASSTGADQEIREVAHDALAVNDIDLTISLIELLAMVRAESADVRHERAALRHR